MTEQESRYFKEGYDAYYLRRGLLNCPHKKENGKEWRKGWQKGLSDWHKTVEEYRKLREGCT